MIRAGHYQTVVPYGYNANIVIDIVKENGQQTNNGWRLTVNDSVIAGKKSGNEEYFLWLQKPEKAGLNCT